MMQVLCSLVNAFYTIGLNDSKCMCGTFWIIMWFWHILTFLYNHPYLGVVYTLHQQLQVSGILQSGHGGTQQEKAIHDTTRSRPFGSSESGNPGCGFSGLAWRFGIDGVPDPKEIDRPVILAALSCLHRNWQVQVNLKVMCVCVCVCVENDRLAITSYLRWI